MIRRFQVHFPHDVQKETIKKAKQINLGSLLSKEIKALAFLDTPVAPILQKDIKALEFLDKKVF